MKRFILVSVVASLLTSCTGYPRILDFPFDPGGRSLNSRTSELSPQIASPYIVFVSDRNGSESIYLYNSQTQSLINLPGLNSLDEVASHPSISEDGRYIVFGVSRQGRSAIFLYDRQLQQKRNLTDNIQGEVKNPTISADGSRIVYEIAKDGQWDIIVCDRFGEPLPIPGNSR